MSCPEMMFVEGGGFYGQPDGRTHIAAWQGATKTWGGWSASTTTTMTACCLLKCTLKTKREWRDQKRQLSDVVSDLHGLLLFLRLEPYWVHYWWKTLLYRPYCHGDKQPLFHALSQVMWRTAKKDVLDQVCSDKYTAHQDNLRTVNMPKHKG